MASSAGRRYTPEGKIAVLESKLRQTKDRLDVAEQHAKTWERGYRRVLGEKRALHTELQLLKGRVQQLEAFQREVGVPAVSRGSCRQHKCLPTPSILATAAADIG